MIASYQAVRVDDVTLVTVTSSLSGTVYFHWWLDGVYQGATTDGRWHCYVVPGQQATVDVIDTTDEDFDPLTEGPAVYPARRTVWWLRSLDGDVAAYRIEQQQDGGDWGTVGTVSREGDRWWYSLTTDRLEDLSDYAWRVVAIDQAGNESEPEAIDEETIVRTPDGVLFDATLNVDTTVTFTAQ